MSIQQYQLTQKGGPFALTKVPLPKPGPGQVSIRPRAVALNGIDWKNLAFGAIIRSYPAVLGIDASGVVEAVGEGVTAFKAGDEVMSYAHGIIGQGAFAEVYTVAQHEVAKKPSGLSFEQAVSLPVIFLTAAATIVVGLNVELPGLSKLSNPNQPKSILVLGGSSGVGASAIQLLRIALPSVTIITTSSAPHHAHLKSLGANVVLERSAQSDAAALKAATPGGAGVDAVIDTVGAGPDSPAVFEAIKADGPKLYALVVTRPDAKLPAGLQSTLVGAENILKQEPTALQYLVKIVEEGKFKLPIKIEVVGKGFEAIEKGLGRFPANVSGTKLVVTL